MLNVKPCNNKNAVKVAAFAIEFTKDIDTELIEQAIKVHESDKELQHQLPRVTTQDAITIQISTGEQVSHKNLGGVQFEKISADGEVSWYMLLRKDSLRVICMDYSRWDEVWPQSKSYLNKILPILGNINIASIILEYIDEFVILDNKQEWMNELFKKESQYLSSNIFSVNDFWHSHHGYFSAETVPVKHRVLNTVNIEYFEENYTTYKTVVRTQHKSSGHDFSISDSNDFLEDIVDKIINRYHIINKSVMSGLLTEEMLTEISLVYKG